MALLVCWIAVSTSESIELILLKNSCCKIVPEAVIATACVIVSHNPGPNKETRLTAPQDLKT